MFVTKPRPLGETSKRNEVGKILRSVLSIAVPVSLENILGNTGIFVLTVFLSKFGETALAINGIANQASFLVLLFLFGLNSGGSIFLAQFWGRKDLRSMAKISTLMMLFSLSIALLFFVVTFFFPHFFIRFFSKSLESNAEAAQFLRIVSLSYFGIALEVVLRTYLRSTERAYIPMQSYIWGTTLQIALAYALMRGSFGLPKLGTLGVAWATTVSRYVIPFYQLLRIGASGDRFLDFGIPKVYLEQFLRYASPTTLNEIAWSLGITAYGVIFGRMGTDVYAARSMLSSFENYVWTFTFGLVISSSVLVGKKIGESNYDGALKFARRMLKVNVLVSVVSALLIMLAYYIMLPTFNLAVETKRMLSLSMIVMLLGAPLKAFNGMAIVGVIRAGGDAKFSFLLETLTLWGIGVPLSYVGAFWWRMPMHFVYALTLSEELVKGLVANARIRSRKWIRNVAGETVAALASNDTGFGNQSVQPKVLDMSPSTEVDGE